MKIINIDYPRNKELVKEQIKQSTEVKAPDLAELDEVQISLGIEENKKIVCRLVGRIIYKGLHIEFIASNSKDGSKIYEQEMFDYVEKLVIKKGCSFIFLETMSFDETDFYLKNGFEVIKKTDNYQIKGETHYFIFKSLI